MRDVTSGAVLRVERLDDRDVPSAVVADFGDSGVWRWTPSFGWLQMTPANPDGPNGLAVAADGNLVVGDFGGSGLWRWTPAFGWQQLTPANPEAITAADNGDILGDFGGSGLWRWTPAFGWQQLTPANPENIWIG
jgi:hypothetical protein